MTDEAKMFMLPDQSLCAIVQRRQINSLYELSTMCDDINIARPLYPGVMLKDDLFR